MSGNGAYEDEMAFLNRPTPEDAELTAFAQSLRAALVVPPTPAQEAVLVPRLAEAARVARVEAPTAIVPPARAPRRRLTLAAQIAFAVAVVPLASAGLAVAGVKLPGPADSAFESVGVDLPNQTDSAGEEPAAGDEPVAKPGDGGTAAGDTATSPGKAKAKGHGGGKAKGKPSDAGGPAQSSEGNGKSKSRGKSTQAPGQANSGRNAGGNGKAKAVGNTDVAPPGQANKPDSCKGGAGRDALSRCP